MADNWTKADLEALIKEVMGIKTLTPTIKKHLTNLILDDNMTYKEVGRCIVYYDEVLHGKFEPLYGLSFVLGVRERAAAYFKKLELDQKRQQTEAQKVVEYQENNIIFNIKSLKHKKRKPKQINIEEIDVEGDK